MCWSPPTLCSAIFFPTFFRVAWPGQAGMLIEGHYYGIRQIRGCFPPGCLAIVREAPALRRPALFMHTQIKQHTEIIPPRGNRSLGGKGVEISYTNTGRVKRIKGVHSTVKPDRRIMTLKGCCNLQQIRTN